MIDNIDLSKIQDENARELIMRLLNLIEKQAADLRDAQNEIQRLRDEVNRLKGEQGKPKTKGNTPKSVVTNHSSEKERSKPHERRRRSKKAEIQINEEKVITVDPAILPKDAKFKGYEDVVVQDILLSSYNTLFHEEKYYAASTGKTYLAKLPCGYKGQFGPGIKALTLVLYFGMAPASRRY